MLASWAVPKGIPADPRKNHLAVRTEDHPLEYLTFAGEIPSGEYGAGTMNVWDTGTYEMHKWSRRKCSDVPRRAGHGRYVLFHTRGNDWMIHRMDPPDDPERELAPEGLRPMNATLGTRPPTGDGWAWELKWDGIRALGVRRRRSYPPRSRATATRSRIVIPSCAGSAKRSGPRDAVLDGEIVALDESGRPSFELLQRRMHVESPTSSAGSPAKCPRSTCCSTCCGSTGTR